MGRDRGLAGIHFVAAAVVLGPKAFGSLIGPDFVENAPDACKDDLAVNIAAARRFVRACLKTASADEIESALAAMMVVPPAVRGALIARELDFTHEVEALERPLLLSHGRADRVVMPATSDYILEHCPMATVSWYEGVGHAPFLEAPDRFDAELAAFARRSFGPS